MNVDRLHTQIKQLLDAGVNVVLLGGTRHQIKQLADGLGTSIVDFFEIDEDIYAGEDFSSNVVHGIAQSLLFSAQVYWLDVAQEAFLTTELAKKLSRFEVIVLSPEPGDKYGEFLSKVRAGMVTNTMIDEINRRCYDSSDKTRRFEVQLVDDKCNPERVMRRRRRGKTTREFNAMLFGTPPHGTTLPAPRTLTLALGELVYFGRNSEGFYMDHGLGMSYGVGWVQAMSDGGIAVRQLNGHIDYVQPTVWRYNWGTYAQFDIEPISVLPRSRVHRYELEGLNFRWSLPSTCEQGLFLSVLAQINSLDQLSLSRPVQTRDLLRLSERDQAFGWFGAVGAVRVVFGARFHRPLELALVLPDQEFSTLVNPGWDVGPDAASAGITADMIRLAPSPRVARKALSRIAQGRRIINPDALNERDEDIRLDLPTPLNVCNTSGDEHAWDNEVSLGKGRSAFRDAARVLAHEKELVARHIHWAADTGYPFDPEAYLLDRQGNITVLGEPQHIAIGLCSQAADYYLGPFSRGVIRKFGQQYPQYRVNDELPCGGLDKALEANLIHQPRQWLVKVDSLQWVGFSGSSCIYPKEELEQLAESLGLIVADGPGVGIGIVFTSDLSSQSRKVKRAWDEGILIAEYAEFVRLVMSKTTEIEAIMNPRYDMY